MKRLYGWGIIRSMVIAYKNLFRKKITVQYPFEKIELPERARWSVEHKFFETGEPKCTACKLCERSCPNFIIDINLSVNEDKSKHINYWRYELGACMMCGICVETCPFDAIYMSHNYELARIDPDKLTYNLLENVDAAQGKKPASAARKKAAESQAEATKEPKEEGASHE